MAIIGALLATSLLGGWAYLLYRNATVAMLVLIAVLLFAILVAIVAPQVFGLIALTGALTKP